MSVSLDEMIACAKRELALRERNYPKWVENGRLKQADATKELDRMRAILHTLIRLNGGGLL